MNKKIVVVTGSPRELGNTELLADAFINGAKEGGSIATKFNAARMNIKPCTDCQYCFSHDGICCQEDQMQEVYKALYEADMLVFASPVYWYGFSAQIKAVIDRLYVHATKQFPIKETALLAVFADEDPTVADFMVAHYKGFTDYLKWKDMGVLTQSAVEGKGDIKNTKALNLAFELGKKVS